MSSYIKYTMNPTFIEEGWHLSTLLTFGGIASMGADFEHFTWWSIASFSLYGSLYAIDYQRHFFWTFMTVQILVISGVIIMGATSCDVFEQAFEDNGSLVYIFGNFLMHYLPSVVAYALADKSYIVCGFQTSLRQIWAAYGFFLVWNILHDPWRVYGCNLPHELGGIGMVGIVFLVSVISFFVHRDSFE